MIFSWISAMSLSIVAMSIGVGFLIWSNRQTQARQFEKSLTQWSGWGIFALSLILLLLTISFGLWHCFTRHFNDSSYLHYNRNPFLSNESYQPDYRRDHRRERGRPRSPNHSSNQVEPSPEKKSLSMNYPENFRKVEK